MLSTFSKIRISCSIEGTNTQRIIQKYPAKIRPSYNIDLKNFVHRSVYSRYTSAV